MTQSFQNGLQKKENCCVTFWKNIGRGLHAIFCCLFVCFAAIGNAIADCFCACFFCCCPCCFKKKPRPQETISLVGGEVKSMPIQDYHGSPKRHRSQRQVNNPVSQEIGHSQSLQPSKPPLPLQTPQPSQLSKPPQLERVPRQPSVNVASGPNNYGSGITKNIDIKASEPVQPASSLPRQSASTSTSPGTSPSDRRHGNSQPPESSQLNVASSYTVYGSGSSDNTNIRASEPEQPVSSLPRQSASTSKSPRTSPSDRRHGNSQPQPPQLNVTSGYTVYGNGITKNIDIRPSEPVQPTSSSPRQPFSTPRRSSSGTSSSDQIINQRNEEHARRMAQMISDHKREMDEMDKKSNARAAARQAERARIERETIEAQEKAMRDMAKSWEVLINSLLLRCRLEERQDEWEQVLDFLRKPLDTFSVEHMKFSFKKYQSLMLNGSSEDIKKKIQKHNELARFTYYQMSNSFERISTFSHRHPDELFLKVIQQSISKLGTQLSYLIEDMDSFEVSEEKYNELLRKGREINPKEIPTTYGLMRTCRTANASDYQDVRPPRQLRSFVTISEIK